MKTSDTPLTSYYLWEASIRVFHWLLVLLVIGMWLTIENDLVEWHARLGIVVVGLLTYRVVLGLFGGELIRFSKIVSSPTSIKNYLQGKWYGFGHNPLGAWAVLFMIALLAWQSISGLFANDDIVFDGPWLVAINKDLSDQITNLHGITANILLFTIIVHVIAIAFYAFFKKERLLSPMIDGWKHINSKKLPFPERVFSVSRPSVIVVAIILGIIASVFAVYGGGLFIAP